MIQRLLGRAASAVDLAVVRAMQSRNARGRRSRARELPHAERVRLLHAVRDAYAGVDPAHFFAAPPPVTPAERRVRPLPDGGEVIDLSWPSTAQPFLDEGREGYLAVEANRTAHARLLVAPTPRPAVILIHGYLGGHWAIEERAWPIAWMRRLGLDVALACLPFHGPRIRGGTPGRFPGANPRTTNEGFRQAVADLRALAAILRGRGSPSVGVMGMSLGGYSTALLATVEDSLSFAVPVIPLASVADFARDHGILSPGAETAPEHHALEEANRIVSPLHRRALLSPERLLVVGAAADRITPIAQAERVARHFGAPLHRLPGGHLLQLGRGEAFREVRRLWQRLGVVP